MKVRHIDYVIYICFAAMGVVNISIVFALAEYDLFISSIFSVLVILMVFTTIFFIRENERRAKNKA